MYALLSGAMLAFGALAVSAADDTEAQARARQAVRGEIDKLERYPGPAVEPADSANIVKARSAVRQKMEQLDATGAGTGVVKGKGKKPQYLPMEQPTSTLAGDKQDRLAEILRLYRADRLSSEEYHRQRAKILAEP
jgi:hypothetical protein